MTPPRPSTSPIRLGVIAPDGPILDWQVTCLRSLLALSYVELAVWIDVDDRAGLASRRATWPLRTLLFDAYRKLGNLPRALRPVTVASLFSHSPRIRCALTLQKDRAEFSPTDVDRIKQYAPDLILDFGTEPLRGAVIGAARYGVWTFATGEPALRGMTMAGFWEIYRRDQVTAGYLVKLVGDGDKCVILRHGHLKTIDHSYAGNVDSLLYEMAIWPAYVCRALNEGNGGALPSRQTSPTLLIHCSPRPPTNIQILRYLWILGSNVVARAFNLLFRFSAWNVAVVEAPIQSFLDPAAHLPIHWLSEPGNSTFRADPFAVEGTDGPFLFFEEYNYRASTSTSTSSKGVISCVPIVAGRRAGPARQVLELPVHMSYPYLFRHEGEIYCVPETAEAREVPLYRAVAFPYCWERACTLLDGVAALDPTVFPWEGRWWLMCTDHDSRSLEALFIFWSCDLFGPWRPHSRNPVKLDIRSARPAGTPFVSDGHLYRPAQDCSGRYGGKVTLNRVIELTPTSFQEDTVRVIEPDRQGPYRHGIHTLSAARDLTLVDGRRLVFSRTAFLHQLRRFGGTGRKAFHISSQPGAGQASGAEKATA